MTVQPLTSSTAHFSNEAQILATLPESLGKLAQLIGIDNTLALIDQYGGTAIYIPSQDRCNEDHDLAIIIGLDSLKTLALHYPTTRYEIPLALALHRRIRDMRIHELAKTTPHRSLARRFHMTERGIRNILSQPQGSFGTRHQDDRQPDLFAEQ